MEQKKLAELTDEELSEQARKNKSYKIYDAVIFGFLIGVAIYSTVKNGLGLLSFLPLVYLPIAAKNRKRRMEIDELMKERKLS